MRKAKGTIVSPTHQEIENIAHMGEFHATMVNASHLHHPIADHLRKMAKLIRDLAAENQRLTTSPYPGGHRVMADIYHRDSTGEMILEISGAINDCSFACRHTAPGNTAPEDVPALEHLYPENTPNDPA